MNTGGCPQLRGRALVLGAGGPLAAAWEIGLAAGLESAGVPVANAERIIGTSAGAIAGCQLAAGISAQSMIEGQIARARYLRRAGHDSRHIAQSPAAFLDELASAGPLQVCRRALQATAALPEDQFIANFEAIFSRGLPWPERFACVGTDAYTAERQLWIPSSGVDVVRTASCCAPYVAQPIRVDGGRFLDGALLSMTNADLAQGFETVLVVAMVVSITAGLMDSQISRERAAIEHHGGKAIIIQPDKASLDAIGPNLMDGTRGEEVAIAGLDQGRREADRLRLKLDWLLDRVYRSARRQRHGCAGAHG